MTDNLNPRPGEPTPLPPSLRSVDDVRRTCEAAGLVKLEGEDVHPQAWIDADRTVGVAVSGIGSSMTGVHVQRVVGRGDTEEAVEVARIFPYVGSADLLVAAIRSAREETP